MKTEFTDHAVIESASAGSEYDGKIESVTLTLKYQSGGFQSFGGLCLDGGPLTASFIQDLTSIFGKTQLDQIVGCYCKVLFSFSEKVDWNRRPEGLETELGRFTLNGWRRKHFPERTQDVITAEIEARKRSIESAEWRLQESRERLRALVNSLFSRTKKEK